MSTARRRVIATLLGALCVAAPFRLRMSPEAEPAFEHNSASARPGGGSAFRGSSRSSFGSRSGLSGSRRTVFSSGSSSSGSSRSSFGSGSSSHYSGSGRIANTPLADFNTKDSVPALGIIAWLFSNAFGTFGVLALCGLLVLARIVTATQNAKLDWQAGIAENAQRLGRTRSELERLRQHDPNFSPVLFDDFLYALYAQSQTLRGGGQLSRLSAYLKLPARQALEALGPVRQVQEIVIGAMRFVWVNGLAPASPSVTLEVEFEANYTEVRPDGASQSYYVSENWVLSRDKAVTSRTPDRVHVFVCPNCGAPLDGMDGGMCRYCQATVDTGRFDWVVENIAVASRETRGPMLTGDTEEQGTRLETLVDENVSARYNELVARDSQFSWPAFQARVHLIFQRFQVSWSNRDWTVVRPFVSDNLFQMLGYWIEAYRREGLRNVTENARIETIEIARITADRFYDAVTVRVFASSTDFTRRDVDGAVVGGSRSKIRRYTEYWTLIRASGRQGAARADPRCPSCGGPLAVQMAGTCTYCQAKVTTGQFDWVLSRIEQDEVYQG